ncbi:DNA mismatch repair protein MutT [Niastella koreensis]|uniref:NUDIX hydrolase n=2 Tax=Niastella koreensis TaxID=354356 RepID=G8TEQ1_NIAKG|nr:NUDIX domain-containing protein [Niastella koreensis]AEW00487.1 NUDIX hydrolase [Niastella koreensis GR20-10]OQP52348.1 DNA mismatch repair protein MutT [Niastella koreensis]
MRIIDKLAWIAIDNKMVLSTRSFGKDKFYIPGGKRETGETDEQALLREIKEELNVDLDKATLAKFGIFEAQAHGHTEGVMVKMTCYTASYSGQLSPRSEIEEMAWLTYADMNRISEVDRLIFDYLKANDLIN